MGAYQNAGIARTKKANIIYMVKYMFTNPEIILLDLINGAHDMSLHNINIPSSYFLGYSLMAHVGCRLSKPLNQSN